MRLTERDFDLLAYLAAQGGATADQLTEKFFKSRKTCQTRLHFLKHADLVEAMPLSALKSVSLGSYKQAIDVLSFLKHDVWKYRVYRLTKRLRHRRAGAEVFSEPMMWKHQLQLNGIRKIIEDWFPGAMILTDPDIQAEARRFKMGRDQPVADLVIRTGEREIAIEVERTQKTETEYYLRFIDYRDSHYSHVLYFCESDRLFNKVAKLANGINKIGVSRLLAPDVVFQYGAGFVGTKSFLALAD
ncbi:hypothetical protein WDW37_17520 [Bdellovibrionota bacterium FG-1]